jgi:large subunit ribosomal protein L17
MRHKRLSRRLSRTTAHRKAMMRNMVTSLFEHDRIETTWAKAKELKPVAEKMITLAKRGDLHARRQAESFIRSHKVCGKLFDDAKERYQDRTSGHVRIVATRVRRGDAAPMALVELIPPAVEAAK